MTQMQLDFLQTPQRGRTVYTSKATSSFRLKLRDPVWYAFTLLRTALTIAPTVFGIDKFFNLLTYWPQYLAPVVNDIAPLGGQPFMFVVGGVEILLGLAVLIAPRYGALLVAGWLAFIIVNLVLVGSYYDVALRDFGLLVAALVLFLLSFHRTVDTADNEQEYGHV